MTMLPPADHNSGWDDLPPSSFKFMAWALVILIIAFVAAGLLFHLI
jgi:hypothetical protein